MTYSRDSRIPKRGIPPFVMQTALALQCLFFPMTLSAKPEFDHPWIRLSDLPESVGLKGMIAGVHEGQLLLAGGSNFPTPLSEGGGKTYHDRIFRRPIDAADSEPWIISKIRLPNPVAEGPSLTTPYGIVAVGGRGLSGESASVVLLKWNQSTQEVGHQILPVLPSTRASAALAYFDGHLFLSGGVGLAPNDAEFLTLNLQRWLRGESDQTWEPLPRCPGPRRFGATLMPVTLPDGAALIQCGGRRLDHSVTADDYLRETWKFDLNRQQWSRMAPLPQPILLGNTVSVSSDRFAIGGGSDGHNLANMRELGERYRLPDSIFVYDALADTWTAGGRLPIGVAAAASVRVDGDWVIAGGEYSPGLRTPGVFRLPLLNLNPPAQP